jgi:hypothetical protein
MGQYLRTSALAAAWRGELRRVASCWVGPRVDGRGDAFAGRDRSEDARNVAHDMNGER